MQLKPTLIAIFLVMLPGRVLPGPVLLNFDELTDGVKVTTQYPGITFSGATAITAGISLNEFEFPPRSGANVMINDGGVLTITYTAPTNNFAAYFTYDSRLTLTFFDINGNQIQNAVSMFTNNMALSGVTGSMPNELIGLTSQVGIGKIIISAESPGGSFVIDDMTQEATGYEADVAPRPNGSGTVVVSDWVQVGRFSVGLDTPAAGSEFQRADCAPRAMMGDGRITVADWVQAGRYSVGLDPLTPAGGPTSLISLIPGIYDQRRLPRELRVASRVIAPDREIISVPVELLTHGGENAASFSLQFDPGAIRYIGVKRGRDLAEGAALLTQTARSIGGRVAFAVALKPGGSLRAGAKEVLQVQFRRLKKASVETEISIVDEEVVDVRAGEIPVRSVNGVLWRRK